MNRYEATIETLLQEAETAAQEQRKSDAAQRFQTLRSLLVEGVDISVMNAKMERVRLGFFNEAKRYKEKLQHHFRDGLSSNKVIVLSDSLALPRPNEMKLENLGLEFAYPYWLQEGLKERNVQVLSWGQRYMTTQLLLDTWDEIKSETGAFASADIIVHIGLNDYVERVFLEEERIAMDWLATELKERIVFFGQRYRHIIMEHQDDYAYVPSKQFRDNIEKIILRFIEEKASSVTFVNQIALPISRWSHTPNYMYNFIRCNSVFYEMSKHYNVNVVDVDRIVWGNGLEKLLNEDLMHLGLDGHKLLAQYLQTHLIDLAKGNS